MQNNIQQRISGLLNAYKRNRRWKILTIVLSVAVLCNTIYAMRQAAVAVTENNGETSQISQIIENNQAGSGNTIGVVQVNSPGSTSTPEQATTGEGTSDAAGGNVETSATGSGQTAGGESVTGSTQATGDEGISGEPGSEGVITDGGTGSTDGSSSGISGVTGNDLFDGGENDSVLDAESSGEADEAVLGAERPVEWVEQETEVGDTIITVGYYSDAFEIPVFLNAKEITFEEEREHYEQIRAAVEEAAAKSDDFVAEGFVAFDIYFHDGSDSYEIEPLEGSLVKVSVTMDGNETPDAEDVAEVLHVKEENGILEARPVEDLYIDAYNETAEFFTESFSDYVFAGKTASGTLLGGDSLTRDAGSQKRGGGEQHPYNNATSLDIWEDGSSETPISEVAQGDKVTMAVGWRIWRLGGYESFLAEGNYIEIQLPDGFQYPATFAQQIPERRTIVGNTYINAGEVATITIENDRYLHITFGSRAEELQRAGNLIPSFFENAVNDPTFEEWMKVEIPGVIVTQEPSSFTPYAVSTALYNDLNKKYVPRTITVLAGNPVTPSNAGNISSAVPAGFRVLDTAGRVVQRARTNDAVTTEISWRVNDLKEIDTADDYVLIELPSGLDFPEVSGAFALTQEYTYTHPNGTQETLWPGTNVAVYEIESKTENGVRKQFLRVKYRLAAVWLNEMGILAQGVAGNALNWATVRVENVRIAATSDFTPAVTINSRSLSASLIEIMESQAGKLDGVNISLRVNGSEGGEGITVGTEDVLKLDVVWDWRSVTRYLASGDYFEVNLPDNLEYTSSNQVTQDAQGNIFRFQVFEGQGGRWVLRVTYEDVQPEYNLTQGYTPISAFILTPPDFNGASSANMSLEANVVGQTKKAYANITVLNRSSSVPDGEWRIRRGITQSPRVYSLFDYSIGRGNTYPLLAPSPLSSRSQVTANLFVLANHGNDLDAEPFYDPYTIDWLSKKYDSNYLVAYCANSYASSPAVVGTGSNPNSYSRYRKIPIEGAGLSSWQVSRLKNMMSTAFPYVDLNTMASNLGESTITQEEAVIAVQGAIWTVVNGSASANYGNKTKINRMINTLANEYEASGTSYSFNGEPSITFNGNSATVSGYIRTAPVRGLTGTFSAGGNSVNVEITERTGRFTATLTGVQKTDTFRLHFSGSTVSVSNVVYFDNTYAASGKTEQDLIAAQVATTPVNLDWEYEGQNVTRRVKVIKRWIDASGNVIEEWPVGATVEVQLQRQVGDNTPQNVEYPVTLSAGRTSYIWENLDATDQNGNVYKYSVSENADNMPPGFKLEGIERGTDPTEPALIVYTATNRKEDEKKTKVTVIKKWMNVSNEEAAERDLRVVVQLFRRNEIPGQSDTKTGIRATNFREVSTGQNGSVYSGNYRTKTVYPEPAGSFGEEVMATLSKENGWKVTFEDLPVNGEDDGKPVDYLIREMAVYEGNELQENYRVVYKTEHKPDTWYDRYGNPYAWLDMTGDEPTATIENSRPEETLEVIKQWVQIDEQGQETVLTENLPSAITATLSARDIYGKEIPEATLKQKYVRLRQDESLTVTLNAENNWTYQWTVYPMDGVTFYIRETGVPVGYTGPEDAVRFVKVGERKYAATLKNVKETEEVTVVKEWSGLTDPSELEGLQIRVGLFRQHSDGSVTPVYWYPDLSARKELSKTPYVLGGTYNIDKNGTGVTVEDTLVAGIDWRVTYKDLPKYDGDELIHYVVKETGVPSGFSVSYKQGGVTVKGVLFGKDTTYGDTAVSENGGLEATIVNTAAGTLCVEKKWVNGDNNEEWTENLPDEIEVILSATLNGKPVEPAKLAEYVNGVVEDGQVKAHLNASNNWSFQWENVQELKGLKYFVTEAQIEPDDYELIDGDGNVIDRNTPIPVEKNKEGVFVVTLTNRRKPYHIIIVKQDKDNKERLGGAEFKLYKSSKDGDASEDMELFGTNPYKVEDNGELKIDGLTIGQTYVLVETKAPKGYVLPQNPDKIVFKIVIENGSPRVRIYKPDHMAGLLGGQDNVTIVIDNTKITYELPEAGGAGTTGYITGGMSLIMATLLMYIFLRKWQFSLAHAEGTTRKMMHKKRKRGASK